MMNRLMKFQVWDEHLSVNMLQRSFMKKEN